MQHPEKNKFFIRSKYIVDKELVGPTPYVVFILSICTIYYGWEEVAGAGLLYQVWFEGAYLRHADMGAVPYPRLRYACQGY